MADIMASASNTVSAAKTIVIFHEEHGYEPYPNQPTDTRCFQNAQRNNITTNFDECNLDNTCGIASNF